MEHKKTGRPSKGLRKRLPVRLPERFATAAQSAAEQRGLSFNDFVAELISAELGLPYEEQEALPLKTSA